MASIFDIPPPPVFTRDGRDGFPPEAEFEGIMAEYIEGLNPRKRDKALMSQSMYDTILVILTNPQDTRCATAQFRFWTKKMFRLVTTSQAQIVTHENRPVAVREQIYDVLVQCHSQCSHGGRDKTSNQVRRYYSWIPKELIARFVKACPLCNARRSAKSGSASAGLAALTALGADPSLLLANGGIGDSSPPSDSSTSSDSAVTTPSRPNGPPSALSSGYVTPYTPGSYLSSAMYQQVPTSNTSMASSGLPPMPSPSSNPQDWTHWVNDTPQRLALSQSANVSAGIQTDILASAKNPVLHFSYHPGEAQLEDSGTICLQTPPRTAPGGSDSIQAAASDPSQMQSHAAEFPAVAASDPIQDAQPGVPSAETQAYFSQLMQQTMATFLQAPPMMQQWSSDSVTTVSSSTSASTQSSSDLSDLDDTAANSPLPPVPCEKADTRDPANIVLQEQIDSLTAHLGGVNANSIEEDEEASFQSFMSSFKQPVVEQDQIDPLLRAMNLDVMQGIPLLNDSVSPLSPVPVMEISPAIDQLPSHVEDQAVQSTPKLDTQATKSKKISPGRLGGNTFKFPPAAPQAEPKKTDKKATRSNSRNLSKAKASNKGSKLSNSKQPSRKSTPASDDGPERQQSIVPIVSTPDLSSYFQLQDTFNQLRNDIINGSSSTFDGTSSCTSQPTQLSQTVSPWQGSSNAAFQDPVPTRAHTEFSFNVADMSNDEHNTNLTNDSVPIQASTPANTGSDEAKMRPRPPQLDFSSFSNNNAFNQTSYTVNEQSHMSGNGNVYLTAHPSQYSFNELSQSTSGSVSAPAHITQFTHPDMPIITPNVSLFNYEHMDMNFGFVGNSFVDYNGMCTGNSNMFTSAVNNDLSYQQIASGNYETGQLQTQDTHRPASAGGYLEPNSYTSPQKSMARQQQMALTPAIHSAPYYHLPMSSQQQQAQARELSEQIQAILDNAIPTNEALEQGSVMCNTRSLRKR